MKLTYIFCFLTIIILNSFIGFSQENQTKHFDLEWNEVQKFDVYNDYKVQLPSVKNQSIDYQKLMPFFYQQWEVPFGMHIKKFDIKNIVYQDIKNDEMGELQLSNVPQKPEINLDAVSTNQTSKAYLRLIPLVKEENKVKKIIAFDVDYTLESSLIGKTKSINTSVLASGAWYKIAVDTTGVYKIDRTFLSNLGINVDNINPKNIQIYGNGGALLPYKIGNFRYDDLYENAIYVAGEDDNRFDANDYILFYAQGADSWKHYNSVATLSHVKNIYSSQAYYFIHISSNQGKRITQATAISGTPAVTFQNFDHYWFYEKDEINMLQAGQRWFGDDKFHLTNEKTFSYTFPDIETASPVKIKTCVAGNDNNISFLVKLNGNLLYTHQINGISSHTLGAESINSTNVNPTQPTFNISFTFNNGGNSTARGYLDYIEIIGKRKLIAQNKQFGFRNFDAITNSGIVSYNIQNANNIFAVWDVTTYTEPIWINNISTSPDYVFQAQGGALKEYVVVNSQNYYTPTKPSDYQVANQNLHAINNIDYLIITDQEYTAEAESLAQNHRQKYGWTVQVVPLHQIYLEFGSGSQDITAIRDFVKHVYDNSNNRLRYLMLYGDASFDFKGIKYQKSIVPVFLSEKSFNLNSSFATDDFYGTVSDNNEGDFDASSIQTLDVAVGRIPFTNHLEAQQINAKIINYHQSASLGDWRNEVLMVVDDADSSTDTQLINYQETAADNLKIANRSMNVKKAWMDAYQQVLSSGVPRYPSVNNLINTYIEKGVLIFSYFGHGGETGLSQERIVEISQIQSWNNYNRLNLFSVISCEFARFDNPLRPDSAGELIIRNPNGAAAHEIATAREISIGFGYDFNKELIPDLVRISNTDKSISEILKANKNNNVFSSERFFIFSLGDPSMRLALPKPDVKITKMNGIPVTQSLDTIKALSRVNFEGIVTQTDGTIDTSYNGEVYLTVFDKPQDKTTLQNDLDALLVTFDTQESKLFRGRAQVTNGTFQIEFVAPQDIKIAYGYGKLSFYAHNFQTDKGGYDTQVVIGGVNYDAPLDNKGPDIKLYMNDTSFIDGGNTNQSPLFIAHLYDENGINTSFSAVDHDITAVLDNNQQQNYVLNEYYITDLNDYTKGSVEYRLRDLSVGHHTITLKAYDTYNNPSEASLNFVVVNDAELVLEHVLNYPNPFIDYTEFWFNHNKPNELLEVQIQIYTVSGKLVKTLQKTITNSGGLSRDITWNGLDDFGQKIGKGVYVYKLSVNVPNSSLKTEIFEKLVILQ